MASIKHQLGAWRLIGSLPLLACRAYPEPRPELLRRNSAGAARNLPRQDTMQGCLTYVRHAKNRDASRVLRQVLRCSFASLKTGFRTRRSITITYMQSLNQSIVQLPNAPGELAQLVERLDGIEKAGGSTPPFSTRFCYPPCC